MAFVELSRQVEESCVLKIFRKVICTGACCFWGSGLYNEMGEAIKRWIVGVSFKEFGLYIKVIKSHEIILIRNLAYAALYLRSLQRQNFWGQKLEEILTFKRS